MKMGTVRIADETLTDVHGVRMWLGSRWSSLAVLRGDANLLAGLNVGAGKSTCAPVAHDPGYDDTAPELALA